MERDARIDIDEFLKPNNPVQGIQDVKLGDADAVFEATIGVILLNRHSGMSVTGEPRSMVSLIGTLLINSMAL